MLNLVEAYASQHVLTSYVVQCVQACLTAMRVYIPQNLPAIWSDTLTRIKTRVLAVTSPALAHA